MNEALPKDSPTAFAIRLLGVTPHEKQAQFLECRAPVRAAACGRRFGKTLAAAIDLLHFAVTHPGTSQMIVAPTHDQSRILWDMCRHLAEGSMLAGVLGRVIESPFPEMHLVTKQGGSRDVESVILARSASHDGRYIRGHGVDRVIADEAAFIPDEVMNQTVPPMLASSPFGEMVMLSTPFGTSGAFYETFLRGQRGDVDTVSFQFPTSCNPHVSARYLERQREIMTALAYSTEYCAEFLADQASVFSTAIIRAAITDDIIPGPKVGHLYVIGYDPAKYADRAGVVVLDITEKPWQAVEVRDIGGREYLAQAVVIRDLASTYNRAQLLLDATAHDQMLEQVRQDGVSATGYKFTNESKTELIDALVLVLERGELLIPRHSDLIRELTYYRYQTTPSGNVKLGAPAGVGHYDDLVTALALAVFEATKAQRRPAVAPFGIERASFWHATDREDTYGGY